MVHSPSLVLADEHTGNLDAETGRRMLDLSNEIAATIGQTIIMVTHSHIIADSADRVLELRKMTGSSHHSDYRVILTCALRYWCQHKRQAVLMLISIALGVSVVFSVDIANHSAKRAFALSLDSITGRTTHQITGGTNGLDENIYTQMRTELGLRNSAPIIEGSIAIFGNGSSNNTDNVAENLQLIGVDMFAEPRRQTGFTATWQPLISRYDCTKTWPADRRCHHSRCQWPYTSVAFA